MSLGFDPEVPAGYQDADIEMRELEARANELEHFDEMIADFTAAITRYESETGGVATALRSELAALERERSRI